MDETILLKSKDQLGKEEVEATLPDRFVAAHLTDQERLLWKRCAEEHIRLEQEHIPSDVAHPVLFAMCSKISKMLTPQCRDAHRL